MYCVGRIVAARVQPIYINGLIVAVVTDSLMLALHVCRQCIVNCRLFNLFLTLFGLQRDVVYEAKRQAHKERAASRGGSNEMSGRGAGCYSATPTNCSPTKNERKCESKYVSQGNSSGMRGTNSRAADRVPRRRSPGPSLTYAPQARKQCSLAGDRKLDRHR